MKRAALVATALLLLSGQVALAILAPSYAGAKPASVGAVVPLIFWLTVPAAAALAVTPLLSRLEITRGAMAAMFAVGLLMRLVWFWAPPPLEDDFYRYLWDGALLAHGFDPYANAPEHILGTPGLPPALAALRRDGAETLAHINYPDLKTIYPGGAELAFAIAHRLAPWRLNGLRLVLMLADLGTVALLALALQWTGRSTLLAALYWLNPLVVFTTIATAHVDGLLPPLLLAVPLALTSARPRCAAGCLAMAVGVKIWPLLLAPMLFAGIARKRGPLLSSALIFAALSLLLLAPLFASSVTPSSGLAAYAGTWSNNNGPFAWASYALTLVAGAGPAAQVALRVAVASLAGAVALGLAVRPLSGLEDALRRSLIIAATTFYVSPAQFPWYALWFLPLAAAMESRPLLLASATLPAYYLFFPLWESGRGSLFVYGTSFLQSVPVWAWLAWSAAASSVDGAAVLSSDLGRRHHV